MSWPNSPLPSPPPPLPPPLPPLSPSSYRPGSSCRLLRVTHNDRGSWSRQSMRPALGGFTV